MSAEEQHSRELNMHEKEYENFLSRFLADDAS